MNQFLQRAVGLTKEGAQSVMWAALANFLLFSAGILSPMVTFWFISDVLLGKVQAEWKYLLAIALAFVALWLILRLEYRLSYDATYEGSAALRIDIANKMRKLPLSYFSKHNLTDLSQTIMMDVSNIEMSISHALPKLIGFLAFFFGISILLLMGNLFLGLAVIVPIWGALVLLWATKPLQKHRMSRYYHRLLANSAIFQEAFDMQQEIKSYSMQDDIQKKVNAAVEETESLHIKAEFFMAFIGTALSLLPYLSPMLVAIIGAKLVVSSSIPVLYFIGYLTAASTISIQYRGISEFVLVMIFFNDSFKRICSLRKEPVQEGETSPLQNFDLVFKDVSFAYGEHQVLRKVSFTAEQGKVTAFIGPSGCGKTTVLRLISRLYDYDQGSICIGGKDVKHIDPDTLYKQVSMVFQDVQLFNTSVMENIRIGRIDASDEEVLEAARLAHVDSIVERLPQGYQTMIGENGSRLSGGERQRISIARAFLKNAPIILLDEISASLDVENEHAIQQSLLTLIEGKTVIIVSHRLRSIEGVDQIVVMNGGCVEAVGTHESLLGSSYTYQLMIEKSAQAEAFCYVDEPLPSCG